MTTGEFTDNIDVLTLNGNPSLLFNLKYGSLNSEKGEFGYGWSHGYESRIEEDADGVKLYLDPENCLSFISDDKANGRVYGSLVPTKPSSNADSPDADELKSGTAGKNSYTAEPVYMVVLDPLSLKREMDFTCTNTGMSDYKLHRNDDSTYECTFPDGTIWTYDSMGRLNKMIQPSGREADISYGEDSMTVSEPIVGKSLTAYYNDSGLITIITDSAGRMATFAYEDDCLVKYTNALGESTTFVYDDNHRIIRENNDYGISFVENTYDEEGRVISQDDALSETPLTYFDYDVDDVGYTVTTGTDRNGSTVVYKSDPFGHVTEIIDKNGHSTFYKYDGKRDLNSETNAVGATTIYSYDGRGDMVSIRDCEGNLTQMQYDDDHNVTSLINPLGTVNSYTYNGQYMISSTDPMGQKKTYSYDENGMLVQENTEGLGSVDYTYENGLQTSVRDRNDQTTYKEYDACGNVIKETYPDGTFTLYSYDNLNRQTSVTDSTGGTTGYTYDIYGNIASVTDANGGTASNVYNSNGWLVATTDALGNTTSYEYDNEGNNIKIVFPDGREALKEYDAAGNVTKQVDKDGNVSLFEYNGINKVTCETLPNGSKTHYEYYPNGDVKKVTYADGSFVEYSYDSLWRKTKSVDNLGNTYEYEYDDNNNVTRIIDPLENVTKNEYNKYGRLVSSTDANNNTSTFEYDANGNCTKKVTPDGMVCLLDYDCRNRLVTVTAKSNKGDRSIHYEYDALGRVTKYTDEGGNEFRTEYDSLGNVTAVIDAKGNVTTRTEYDKAGHVKKTTDALGVSSTFEYDVMGNMTSSTNYVDQPTQTATSYAYDALDRLISSVDAENGESSYTYDSVGNITSVTDPNGGKTAYTYDSMGRMTESLNAIGSKNTYTYNAQGLLAEAKDAKDQSTTYEYDALGRITSYTDSLDTVSYAYDNNGNVLTVTDSTGTISRKYDCMNRVTEYTDARGNTVKYAYDTLGNLVTLTYPGGEIVRYSYYPTGRIKTVTDWNNKVTSYEYDGNGRLTKTTRPDGSVETREYDKAGKLIKQNDLCGDKVINSFTYTYDTTGNIVKLDSQTTAEDDVKLQSASMEYDKANHLVKYNGEEVSYDANGNMTYGPLGGVMTQFEYDCRNRLISAGNTTYAYDAENNRISVTVAGVRTDCVVENNYGDLSKMLSSTTNGKTTKYIYGSGLIAQNDEENGYLYYHFNNIGSTTAVTDGEGKLKYAFSYGTYGELTSGDTHGIMFLYNGEFGVATDANGLYYMRARYYNVDIKRFINQDVVEGNITNSPSLNKYAYCQGNPVSQLDPFGLKPMSAQEEALHALLDALGVIPVLGAIPDLINAAWYAKNGHYASALLSFVAAIPALGDAIGLYGDGIKWGCKAKKIICAASALINAKSMYDSLNDLARISGDITAKVLDPNYKLTADDKWEIVKGVADVIQTLGAAVGVGNSLNGFRNSQCFVEGTLVLTKDGNKPIEEIKSGDLVYSTNPETGESEYKEVARVFRRESEVLIHIFVNGEEIKTTPDHPFWVENQWVEAKNLREGDILTLSDGTTAAVTKTYAELLDEPVIVYNFEVKDFHTYYVTDTGVLVHNASKYDGNNNKDNNNNNDGRKTNDSWHRMTSKESAEAAKELGFEKTNMRTKNGEPIYYNRKTKTYISQDIGSGNGPHNGGVWKQAKKPDDINSRTKRMGTYDKDLNRIGD